MTAFVTALRRPDLWPAALATFLLHGGVAVAALPILVLPSTVGVATFFGPTSVTPAGPSPSLVAFGAVVVVALAAWAIVGGLVAAAAEISLVRATVQGPSDPDHGARDSRASRVSRVLRARLPLPGRIVVARAVTSFPVVIAAGWAAPRLGAAGYAQLTHPSDPSASLILRVLAATPESLAALAAGWLLANALGAIAARRIVLLDEGAFAAAWRALLLLVRRPVRSLAVSVGGAAVSVAVIGLALVGARGTWLAAADALEVGLGRSAGDPARVALAIALVAGFVGTWALALALAGLLGTWRGMGWTAMAFLPDESLADGLDTSGRLLHSAPLAAPATPTRSTARES